MVRASPETWDNSAILTALNFSLGEAKPIAPGQSKHNNIMTEKPKIISMTDEPQVAPPAEAPPQPLTVELVNQIYGAMKRLNELTSSPVAVPGKDGEIAGLSAFVTNRMVFHGPELLTAWKMVALEYAPLWRAVGALLTRGAMSQTPQHEQGQDKPTVKEACACPEGCACKPTTT